MKAKFPIRLLMVMAMAGGGLIVSGCWPPHPHSTYVKIHQDASNGDAAGVATDLAAAPEDLNLPEDKGQETPLHLAAENCHSNVVVLLLDKGAKINMTDQAKATPLHLAAQEGCADVVEILLARGARVNERDDQGRTPLKRAELWHQDAIVPLLRQHGGTE